MIVQYLGTEYRLTSNGNIEFLDRTTSQWKRSAHTEARDHEIPTYERMYHPLLPLLREKFNRNKATTENNHS